MLRFVLRTRQHTLSLGLVLSSVFTVTCAAIASAVNTVETQQATAIEHACPAGRPALGSRKALPWRRAHATHALRYSVFSICSIKGECEMQALKSALRIRLGIIDADQIKAVGRCNGRAGGPIA